jgi:nucleotide-binding universal stress UspA family protein
MSAIVVAVDGSKHSEKIVDYAVTIAKAMSAKIVLIHVMPEVPIPEEYVKFADNERVNPQTYYGEVSEKILEDMGDRIAKENVKFEGVHGVGNPTKFILDTAQSRKADLIVVGVHGLHRLARVRTLGSVARRVVENSPIPVVTVP